MSSHHHHAQNSDLHSTGRGGAGNIGDGEGLYTDGGIVREGPAGQPAYGHEYSTGRGGAGNVLHGDPPAGATNGGRAEQDYTPEPSTTEKHQENYHTGRGGQGNVHKDKYGGHSTQGGEASIVDKVKEALHMGGKK